MESPAPAGRVASAALDPRRWWAFTLLCGAFFMVLLDGTITIVALPSIRAGLRFSEQGLQWVLSAYVLTFGGLLLPRGRAADLLGRRRAFMAGAVFFATASLLCGLARLSHEYHLRSATGMGWGTRLRQPGQMLTMPSVSRGRDAPACRPTAHVMRHTSSRHGHAPACSAA